MFAAQCVERCDKAGGGFIEVGEFVVDPEAWRLCMPGYRNAAPRFKPADDTTKAKVSQELAALQPVVDQTKVYLQGEIDRYAASNRFQIDPETGFFKRDEDGVLVGKLEPLEMHIMETAEGYGLKPNKKN